MGSVACIPLKVLCKRGQEPLMIELCASTLNYLAEVVHDQISQAAIAKNIRGTTVIALAPQSSVGRLASHTCRRDRKQGK